MRQRKPQRRHDKNPSQSDAAPTLQGPIHSFSYEAEWPVERPGDVLVPASTPQQADLTVPTSIFSGAQPALQAIVRYLRDEEGLAFDQMAELLDRAESTLRATYRNANIAAEASADGLPLDIRPSPMMPLTCFALGLSPLETVVHYLLGLGLRNVEIAAALGLDPRTTSTVKRRITEKGVHA